MTRYPQRLRLPWRRLLAAAAAGVLLALALVLPSNLSNRIGLAAVATPGERGPAAAVFHHDFPHLRLPHGIGADGQMFYALAREPMHLRDAAHALDRPQYRAQRILFPMLAWVLHPSGGGTGLVVALVVAGAMALFVGSIALGMLSSSMGGRAEVAALFAILPGALMSLNLSVGDALAVGLALLAIALDLRRHPNWAIVAGAAAALSKESLIVVLVGYALWRRGRQGLRFAGIPIAVAGAWWCTLRLMLPASGRQVIEFDPGHGLFVSVRYWLQGNETAGAAVFLAAIIAAVMALRRGAWNTPVGWAIVLQLAFVGLLGPDVIAITENGSRATLPLLALAIAAWTVPPNREDETNAAEGEPVSSPRAVLASVR